MVSAILLVGDCHINRKASIIICSTPMPMQNWNMAPYSNAYEAGLMGAGRYMPVVGTWRRVMLVKKSIISFQRLEG